MKLAPTKNRTLGPSCPAAVPPGKANFKAAN